MSDILSPDEIIALTQACREAGGAPDQEKQVRAYDFARPDKFTRDHIRSLTTIHSKHASTFALALSTMIRTETSAQVVSLDQMTFREYCASVPDGTLFAEVELRPLDAIAICEFNPVLVATCVDLLAGGAAPPPAAAATITEIDLAVMKPVIELSLRKYADVWSGFIELEPRISAMKVESRTQQILPGDWVLTCSYEITCGECRSAMSICIPSWAVEPMLPRLTPGRALGSRMRQSDRVADALRRSFHGVEVECRAILGKTMLSVEEITGLAEGDLIRLPATMDGPTELWVESVPTFTGTLGLSGRKLAIKIAGPIAKPDAETE